jgi:chemotaxis protein CheX
MNAQHVNPFVEAAMEVLGRAAAMEVRRGHLSWKPRAEPSYAVSIIVGVFGLITGQVVYSLHGTIAARLVDALLPGRSPEEKKVLFLDCLGEVGNMITGRAAALLEARSGRPVSITTPAVAAGSGLAVHLAPRPALVLGLVTAHGPIEVSIAVEEQEILVEADGVGVLAEV